MLIMQPLAGPSIIIIVNQLKPAASAAMLYTLHSIVYWQCLAHIMCSVEVYM